MQYPVDLRLWTHLPLVLAHLLDLLSFAYRWHVLIGASLELGFVLPLGGPRCSSDPACAELKSVLAFLFETVISLRDAAGERLYDLEYLSDKLSSTSVLLAIYQTADQT